MKMVAAGRRRSDCSGSEQHPPKKVQFENELLCVNTIRALGADQPQEANSGHPGAPMGCAPMAHCLFAHAMKYNGKAPNWINRDRFVLSNGHACALVYSMLHLSGFEVSINDLKNFRQSNSITPGHPERGITPGIEVTTGPLGQGISNAVGLAIAAHHMEASYNRPNFPLFDNYTFCICGDGCLQEGVASEASSLAGHLGLGRLIVLYDANKITIDGSTDLSFTENVLQRYEAYGWHTSTVQNGDTDLEGILKAIADAKAEVNRPSIIKVCTTIAYGSKHAGSEKTHGSPLGAEDIDAFKKASGLVPGERFHVPSIVQDFYATVKKENEEKYQNWSQLFKKYEEAFPELATQLKRVFEGKLHEKVLPAIADFVKSASADSTRALSGKVLNAIKAFMPEMMGGSADLTGSNSVGLTGELSLQNPRAFKDLSFQNRFLHFGVREHGMAAICNGLMAYGGIRPFCATFLNFITYAWGAVRLSALSHFGVLYVATHDSIELGQDGPTHQPVEVMPLLRSTPNLVDLRPADAREVGGSYAYWVQNTKTPVVLCLCRGTVPAVDGTCIEKVSKGGYVVSDFSENGKKKVVIAGSGTELHLCALAKEQLANDCDVRVVSMPSWSLFRQQPIEYQRETLCMDLRKKHQVVCAYVEASSDFGWEAYFDVCIGMKTFGASAPKAALWKQFGLSPENIAQEVKSFNH